VFLSGLCRFPIRAYRFAGIPREILIFSKTHGNARKCRNKGALLVTFLLPAFLTVRLPTPPPQTYSSRARASSHGTKKPAPVKEAGLGA
jgi:hypothetical protein